MHFRISLLVILLAAGTLSAQVLYDPTQANLPDAQGWSYLALGSPPLVDPPQVTRSFDSGTTQAVLNTQTDRTDAAGYSSHNPFTQTRLPAFPVLPVGTTLSFDLDIRGEGHNLRDDNGDLEYDRAGFSVIALLSNGKGVELGFFTDTVWAYDYTGGLFVHAEEAPHDTTAGTSQHYDLVFGASTYQLSVNNVALLNGPIHDYSASGQSPYTLNSYLFFGDDTTSADSTSALGEVSVLLPEPAVGLIPLIGLIKTASRTARRSRRTAGCR